jgi:hypothetical protein
MGEIKMTTGFSSEIKDARGESLNIFQMLTEKHYQPRILFPEIVTFEMKGE